MSTTRAGLLARAATTIAVGTALLAAPGLTTTAVAADPTTPERVAAAAHYLEQQLVDGGHHFSVTYSGVAYADPGVTADAVLALDAAGAGQDEAVLATQYLASDVVGYTGFGDPTEIYAGSVAKLLNVAIAQGLDPHAFGGTGGIHDLVATLQSLQAPSGRYSDQSAYGDSSNVFGQSLALVGLLRAGISPLDAGRDYLLLQQCPGGGFRLDEADTACTDASTSDPDATAMAVQALIAVGGAPTAVDAALGYLVGLQGSDGGVGGAGPQSGTNANSTGLAAQALLAGGRTVAAQAAVAYLESLQYGCAFPDALRGGIAYDQAAYDSTLAAGAGATPSDQDRRSTSQALLALAGAPLASVTNDGAAAGTTALPCPATPTPSTTPTGTASTTSSTAPTPTPSTTSPSAATTSTPAASASSSGTGSAAVGSAGDTTASPVLAATSTGRLAATGSDPWWPVLLGLALVLVGAVAVVGSRRRGAHR